MKKRKHQKEKEKHSDFNLKFSTRSSIINSKTFVKETKLLTLFVLKVLLSLFERPHSCFKLHRKKFLSFHRTLFLVSKLRSSNLEN